MARYFECFTCRREFPAGWEARDDHCQSTGHDTPPFECERCPAWFYDSQTCMQHMNDRNHFPYLCYRCDESWPTIEDLNDHEIDDHFYCSECQWTFDSWGNVRMHLRSRAHLGKNIQCPFCTNLYTTAAGVADHVESGSCPYAFARSRDSLYRFMRSRDHGGRITKKRRSPYEQSVYHCPQRSCPAQFKCLAGLINHLESETCGCTRFQSVQDNIGDLLRTGRFLV